VDSILALFEILIDTDETTENRLEAAEQILAYEAPAKAVDEAKAYLTEVFSNRSISASLRLQAIKLMRKAEARKITRPPVKPIEDLSGRLERARARLDRARESENEDLVQNLPNVDQH
jgi:hypothetical protein